MKKVKIEEQFKELEIKASKLEQSLGDMEKRLGCLDVLLKN